MTSDDQLELDEDALYMRAVDLAMPVHEANLGRPSADVSDEHAVAVAAQICGWCALAAGDAEADWAGAKRHTLDEIRSHALTCEHNPIVKELAQLRARLAELDKQRAAFSASTCEPIREEDR